MNSFEVHECARRLQPWIIKTPLVEIEALSQRTGKRVYLKLESMQRTGAFKFRGAMNYMLSLDQAEAQRGVITASSGNHGLGISLAGKLVGVKRTVVMPESAPLVKQERAKGYGASLILHGHSYDEAQGYAQSLAEQHGYAYVPSFNHPVIIEGQGTIMREIIADLPQVDLVIAPVGGGGLISGLLLAGEQLQSNAQVVGVEPFGAACMSESLNTGSLTTLTSMQTIADGVAVMTPGSLNFQIVRRFQPTIQCISDDDVVAAQSLLLREAKLIVETAAAVSVAGLFAMSLPATVEHVVCVISGCNVDLSYLSRFIS